MSSDDAGPARLLRLIDGAWSPVGPVLPPVEDDQMHAELTDGALVHWHLPTVVEACRCTTSDVASRTA